MASRTLIGGLAVVGAGLGLYYYYKEYYEPPENDNDNDNDVNDKSKLTIYIPQLPNFEVEITGEVVRKGITDEDGYVVFDEIPAGFYSMIIDHQDYEKKVVGFEEIEPNSVVFQEIELVEEDEEENDDDEDENDEDENDEEENDEEENDEEENDEEENDEEENDYEEPPETFPDPRPPTGPPVIPTKEINEKTI